jgi:hypothetical protein
MNTEPMTSDSSENSAEVGIDVQRLVRKDDFRKWWDIIGSGLSPAPDEDTEEFALRVCFEAWQQRGLLISANNYYQVDSP